MSKALSTAYAVYGIPPTYVGITWDDIEIPKPEKDRYINAFENPIPSTIIVQGTAAPIINQLVSKGYSVSGLNLATLLANPFDLPTVMGTDILLIHSIGKYTGKYEIANTVLTQILQQAKSKCKFIILQSEEPWTFIRDNYGVSSQNKIKLPIAAEPKWL